METPLGSLSGVLAFVRTVETGSFTAAAKSLRVTPAAVSRSVARLEEQLSARFFARTTRSLRITPTGQAYYESCQRALTLLAEAERTIAAVNDGESGIVRVSLPTTFGLHVLLPRLRGFRERHPSIELEVQISNQTIDFVREGFDLAVRMGPVDRAGLVARKLADAPLGLFASPAYLARRGRPRSVDALASHDLVAFVMPRTSLVLPWLFASPNEELVPRSALRCAEDPRGVVALAVAGEGIAQTYHFMVERELEAGQLVPVLEARRGRTRRFSLVYPAAGAKRRAVRAVIDELLAASTAR